jgi:RNA recognition motif-containing protein
VLNTEVREVERENTTAERSTDAERCMKKLYVGNFPWSTTEEDLRELFTPFGEVEDVALIRDRDTGRSRGFGFIQLDDAGADKAIQDLDGQDYGGRPLKVNEAQEKPRRPSGGGGRY